MARLARIAGMVLAAGLSRRMGGPNKLLLELAGKSLVRRAVETALATDFDPLLVVLGHERERVEAELQELSYAPIFNPSFASGMQSSLRAGLAAVPADCAGAALVLADMPLVTSAMLRQLTDSFRKKPAPLVLSTYAGIVAPPILYARELFAPLMACKDEREGKSLVQSHRGQATELCWPGEVLADLDVPEDLRELRASLARKADSPAV